MTQSFYSGTPSSLSLHGLIADLNWKIQLLNSDIAEEEQASRIVDAANYAYPTLAKHLRERRSKLLSTVATLQAKLATIDPSASAAA